MPTPDRPALELIPLGGLGEIGMNCMALQVEGKILVVDCGITFPHGESGVDVIHPDFSWLIERARDVLGIFVTHGHEDHIGALPYLLRHLDVPVWGPPHALRLVEFRLADHEMKRSMLLPVAAGEVVTIGPFEVEPVRVSHSIVEATALYVRAAGWSVVHSGDFKFDPEPSDGEPTDEARLRQIGDAGVDLLMSDSTNVDRTGDGGSESLVKLQLEELIGAARGRVVVALFSSNVQRLISLGQIAEITGRKICLLGRSLDKNVRAATEVGRLSWASNLCVAPEQLDSLPRAQTLVLAGGTQGEANSAMARIARDEHPAISLGPDDTVIFSSRIIPGNEHPVMQTLSGLYRLGARVHTWASDPAVHVSGHATRNDQTAMIELLRPRAFLPLHGTAHHLVRHAELARSLGVAEVTWIENGTVLALRDGRFLRAGTVPSGRVAVDLEGGELSSEVRQERTALARGGICCVSLVVASDGTRASSVAVVLSGVRRDSRNVEQRIASQLQRLYDASSARWRRRGLEVSEELTREVRRWLEREHRLRPLVEVRLLRRA